MKFKNLKTSLRKGPSIDFRPSPDLQKINELSLKQIYVEQAELNLTFEISNRIFVKWKQMVLLISWSTVTRKMIVQILF